MELDTKIYFKVEKMYKTMKQTGNLSVEQAAIFSREKEMVLR